MRLPSTQQGQATMFIQLWSHHDLVSLVLIILSFAVAVDVMLRSMSVVCPLGAKVVWAVVVPMGTP